VRAEWSGTMRGCHCVWIHPLARCGSAAAVAIARSNTCFGERRRRQTGERQGGAYRADHRHPSRLEAPLPTFPVPLSSRNRVWMAKAALHTAQRDRLSAGEQRHQNWRRTMVRSTWRSPCLKPDRSQHLKFFIEKSGKFGGRQRYRGMVHRRRRASSTNSGCAGRSGQTSKPRRL